VECSNGRAYQRQALRLEATDAACNRFVTAALDGEAAHQAFPIQAARSNAQNSPAMEYVFDLQCRRSKKSKEW